MKRVDADHQSVIPSMSMPSIPECFEQSPS